MLKIFFEIKNFFEKTNYLLTNYAFRVYYIENEEDPERQKFK